MVRTRMRGRHGTIYSLDHGALARVVDRTGAVWAELAWTGETLARLAVPGATVDGARIRDPLVGDAHAIESRGTTAMSAIDWAAPAIIPTIAAPGALAPNAGGAILNTIALLAEHAGVTALRYAGPYPTPALYRALLRSYRTTASEDAFTADLVTRAARLATSPIAIDFVPAPCERVAHANGFAELRETLERVVVADIAYEPAGSPARLVDHHHCEIWFGDAPYARVASFSADGTIVDGPHEIPACTSSVIGQRFPPQLAEALADLIGEAVPAPLGDDARRYVATHPITWADLGARAARATYRDGSEGLAVHAAIWERIAPLGLPRLALSLVEALVPVVATAIVSAVTTLPLARGRASD